MRRSAVSPSETEEEDEVVLRVPVHFTSAAERSTVSLLQSPLRPRWRPYELDDLGAARIRPKQHRIELPLEDSESEMAGNGQVRLTSSRAVCSNTYAVGLLRVACELEERLREGAAAAGDVQGASLSLTPLDACVQLRPSFYQADEAAKGAEAAKEGSEGGGEGKAAEAQSSRAQLSTVIKRAETDKEVEARQKSYSHLVETREQEPWSRLHLLPADSAEASAKRRELFGSQYAR
mmetsp:Transcript_45698/g.106606  ORF Transcript_45698/g.106606 Transcript_45698/m.106606 type:complete len:235 (-) Transcript_45698:269-973(-)